MTTGHAQLEARRKEIVHSRFSTAAVLALFRPFLSRDLLLFLALLACAPILLVIVFTVELYPPRSPLGKGRATLTCDRLVSRSRVGFSILSAFLCSRSRCYSRQAAVDNEIVLTLATLVYFGSQEETYMAGESWRTV